jgi:hypothetical protein
MADNGVSAPTAHIPAPKELLSEILSSALAVDRRSTRYPRLRAAMEAGLLPASALKVRRKAGKHLSDEAERDEGKSLSCLDALSLTLPGSFSVTAAGTVPSVESNRLS